MGPTKSQTLRRLIEDPEPLVLVYGACALHAKMAERLGLKAIALSGGWASVYLMGHPDAGLTSLSEMVMLARYMAMATNMPVIADADQGFGNAINTYYTVQAFINAGVAGVHIEDQPFPKRCGFVKGKELVSMEEMVGKLQAARDAKLEMDPDFVIIARVEALTAAGGGFDEAIRRAKAYREEGGADVLYIEGVRSVEEIQQVRDAVEGPLFCSIHALIPHPSVGEMKEMGQCIVQLASLICLPAIIAGWDTVEAFQRRGMEVWNEHVEQTMEHPLARLRHFDLVGFPEIREMEEKYLTEAQLKKYAESSSPLGLYNIKE